MKIAVASGKGGTGKTFLTSCLARVLAREHPLVLDVDVEEPNAGVLLPHQVEKTMTATRPVPGIDEELCTRCGICARVCNFNALVVLPEQVLVFSELCHSCNACAYFCPEEAIKYREHDMGTIEKSPLLSGGELITGKLKIGEAQTTPLIRAVKSQAEEAPLIILDCPPGTTCPMIEAVRDSDYCLLVTEPTPFGAHDLKLSLQACRLLGVPCGLVINRWLGQDQDIASIANQEQVNILARIPFSRELAQAYARGEDLLQAYPALEKIMVELVSSIKGAKS